MTNKLIFTFLLFTTLCGYAQKGSLSPYSFYGVGKTVFKGTAENRMMGGLTSYSDSIHLNISNPASLADLKLVNYSLGVDYNSTIVSDGNSRSDSYETASLNYLAVAIPTKHFSFAFGLLPQSSVGYRLLIIDENVVPNESLSYEGDGGVNKTFLSLGLSPLKNLGLGISFHYNFGNIESRFIRSLEEVERSTRLDNQSSISGFELKFAAQYHLKLSESIESQFHFSYSPEAKIDSNNSRFVSTLLGSQLTDQQEIDLSDFGLNKTEITLPTTSSVGFGLGQDTKWYLGAQYTFSESEIDNPFINFDNASYEKATQLSIGGFYIPDFDSFSSYWSRIVYRIGFRTENTGLIVNNQSIKDFGITFGVGLPLNGFSNANIGIEIGKMGTKDANLIEENYINIRLGLSLNDRWFIKRQYD